MNAQNAKDFLPLVQALADGKTIQMQQSEGVWFDRLRPNFGADPEQYRIKPDPRTFEVWLMPSGAMYLKDKFIIAADGGELITMQEVLK